MLLLTICLEGSCMCVYVCAYYFRVVYVENSHSVSLVRGHSGEFSQTEGCRYSIRIIRKQRDVSGHILVMEQLVKWKNIHRILAI